MMSDKMALQAAINLVHVPSLVRLLRSEPLPDGVQTLLRIAAGEAEAERVAAILMGRSPDVVRQAATFFIEQVLFSPYADSYRVLGATPQASAGELRQNVALLLRWLHPDLDPNGERSVFIGRVTAAWNDLKTPQRRAAYDAARPHKRKATKRHLANEGGAYRRPQRRLVSALAYPSGGRAAGSPYPRNREGLLYRALSVLFRLVAR